MTDGLARDLRLAVRELRRSWAFTSVTVATLALGIGATTTMFAVADAVLFRALPFPDLARLVVAGERRTGTPRTELSHANFVDWQSRATSFERMAALTFANWTFTLQMDDPLEIPYRPVSGDFFDVLGARAALGRTLVRDDDRRGVARVVVISDGLWHRQFGGDPAVVGRPVTIDRRPYTVVGVMPRDFRYPSDAEAWAPLAPALADPRRDNLGGWLENRDAPTVHVLGRLRAGVAMASARAELDGIIAELADTYRRAGRAGATMATLADDQFGGVRPVMFGLVAAATLLALVTAVNVAGLLLVQTGTRRKEFAIALALGLSRGRMVRRLLVESALLATLASVAGAGVARVALPIVVGLAPPDLPRVDGAAIDSRVLLVTLGAAGLMALVCWTASAVSLRDVALARALRTSGRGTVSSRAGRSARCTLVGLQVATAVVLVAFAGLLVQSVRRLDRLDLGFDARGLIAASIPGVEGMTPAQGRQYRGRVLDGVMSLPGVDSAAVAYGRPLKGPIGLDSSWRYEGQTRDDARDNPFVNVETISPGYFTTMRTRLIHGRAFTDQDRDGSQRVVIVNEQVARHAWPGQSALGKRIRAGAIAGMDDDDPPATVVGVVADIRYRDLRTAPLDVYLPVEQSPFVAGDLLVRASGTVVGLASAVRGELRRHAPDDAITLTSMERALARHQAPWRSNLAFVGLFAGLTVALALIGVYALLASIVAERSREIGIRLALGATAGRVMAMVFAEGGRVALAGVVLGVVVALAGARTVQSLLFEVPAIDAITLVAAPVVLLAVALAACALPAARAARVDPAITLRAE